ncbi:MAG: hypothetical protein U5O39_12685 [Gammaproteobacteria bacterium]|nr:hypothetical protein [Gammaproteobacteria bacterium]
MEDLSQIGAGTPVMRRVRKVARFLMTIAVVTAGSLAALGISPADWPEAMQTAMRQLLVWIQQAPAVSGAIALVIVASAAHAFFKRSQTPPGLEGPYFDEPALLDPPLARPGYSDRMAYLMAEFAELAYYVIEPNDGRVEQLIAAVENRDIKAPRKIAEFVNNYYSAIRPDNLLRREPLTQELAKANFQYVSHFNRGSTQGFISLRRSGAPLIVVAFRGSEREVEGLVDQRGCVALATARGRFRKPRSHRLF